MTHSQASPYQARVEANAAATAAQAATVVAALQADRVELPAARVYLFGAIRTGASRAITLADLGLADNLGRQIGRPVPVVGLVLPDETARQITDGVVTVTDSEDDPDELQARVERLARAAPLDAGNEAYQQGMARQGVPGWIRVAHPDCCQLCQALADGKVIPISKKMITHPNDRCVPEPVLTGARPEQLPQDGPHDPAQFVPTTLTTGAGIAGRSYTRVRPGLTVSRSVFIPSTRRAAR